MVILRCTVLCQFSTLAAGVHQKLWFVPDLLYKKKFLFFLLQIRCQPPSLENLHRESVFFLFTLYHIQAPSLLIINQSSGRGRKNALLS